LWLEANPTTIHNQNAVLNLFLKITGVGAASCREAVFSIPQRRIRLKDGRFKNFKSGFKILDRAKEPRLAAGLHI
jgi:hypothetical protein